MSALLRQGRGGLRELFPASGAAMRRPTWSPSGDPAAPFAPPPPSPSLLRSREDADDKDGAADTRAPRPRPRADERPSPPTAPAKAAAAASGALPEGGADPAPAAGAPAQPDGTPNLAHVDEQLRRRATEEALALGLRIARTVLGAELSERTDRAARAARDALAQLADARQVVLRVHEDDVAGLEALGLAGVTVQPDAALQRGDVMLATDHGVVDERVETRLRLIERALREAL